MKNKKVVVKKVKVADEFDYKKLAQQRGEQVARMSETNVKLSKGLERANQQLRALEDYVGWTIHRTRMDEVPF